MAKRKGARSRGAGKTAQAPKVSPGVHVRATEAERQEAQFRAHWQARQKRNVLLGVALGLLAVLASFAWSLRNEANSISAAVASGLGPTTSAVPRSPLGNFHRINTEIRSGSKPQVLMVGTQFCEYCAAERWALVKALGRFGTWASLDESSNGAGIPTFDLTKASYSSWYIAVDHKDLYSVDDKPLQTLSRREKTLFNRYDPSGTTPLLIVGRYALVGQGVAPDDLLNRTFSRVQSTLVNNQQTGYTKAINAEANLITAMLCSQDGGRPHVFCSATAIKAAQSRLR
jgi:hypothetical protein